MPKKVSWAKTRCYHSTTSTTKALARATKARKIHLNFVEDIEHNHQMLIDMKEQY
jgi:hypothetical protein